MSAPQRSDELDRFRSNSEVSVMLFSLLAGSTGLNLTVRLPAACRGCARVLEHPIGLCDAVCLLWSVSFVGLLFRPPPFTRLWSCQGWEVSVMLFSLLAGRMSGFCSNPEVSATLFACSGQSPFVSLLFRPPPFTRLWSCQGWEVSVMLFSLLAGSMGLSHTVRLPALYIGRAGFRVLGWFLQLF